MLIVKRNDFDSLMHEHKKLENEFRGLRDQILIDVVKFQKTNDEARKWTLVQIKRQLKKVKNKSNKDGQSGINLKALAKACV